MGRFKRWLNQEVKFTQNLWWRLFVGIVTFTIVGYGVSHFIVKHYNTSKILPPVQETNPSGYVPPTSSPPKQEFHPPQEAMVNVEDTSSHTPGPRWDWEGDTLTEPPVEQEALFQDDLSLEFNEIELEVLNEEASHLRDESAEIRAEANEMLKFAIPLLVEQLNAMSIDEQRSFLAELKATMTDYFPPTLKELADKDPKIAREGWQSFIAQLQDYGFEPPD